MSIISWNCQGMGPPWKLQFLQDVIRQQRPAFVFLCETLSNKKKMEWVRTRIGFQGMIVVEAKGRSGGLSLLWKDQDQVPLLSVSDNHIDVCVSVDGVQAWRLKGFYGEPDRSKRRRTWELLKNLSRDSNLSWCTIGDMNNILSKTDKKGGDSYPQWLIEGFNETLVEAGLKDIDLYGHAFTWERGRSTDSWIEIRLDRAMATDTWRMLALSHGWHSSLAQLMVASTEKS
ncbi:Endonuclease/exonuclease/phosphatase family protein [Heracleum sosnowskyi]|uniref:Endonuclease/exonuclease/phosphatase family protein n=1 Tax=Heracleum sosnowskyi TaxID=360622 RepID=A0AAD8I535_9APIA|nr:Endonuclease/exonuclease/phosphatase family protein [Heracleum sosnowskyi]